jgi:DNA-binding response OmpR family regulator
MRLLLIDHDDQLGQLSAKSVQLLGYDADCRTTLATTCRALMKTSYSALILDPELPDGDGLSIVEELRDRQCTMPVLVISRRGGPKDG